MRSVYDFPEVEGRLKHEAEHYDSSHPNQRKAAALLVSTNNLQTVQREIQTKHSDCITDDMKFQHTLTRNAISALYAVYWLAKHHRYVASHGRLRYLLEGHLIIRDLNRRPQKAAQKWSELRQDIENQPGTPQDKYEVLTDVDYLSGVRGNAKGDLADEHGMYGKVYSLMSNIGSHPHSIRSALIGGSYRSEEHNSILTMGLWFNFCFAAQFMRTFEKTPGYRDAREAVDPIFVDIRLALDGGLLKYMKYEIDLFAPEVPSVGRQTI